ncbi:MAG: PLP-dependent aminotransferase family protein [Firmicutes bacterium]|nr:PLP-dependent aminotransferase family protein [Bacillota bacterium]
MKRSKYFLEDWQPNRKSSLPLYLQIMEYLKEKIINGEWPVGSRIPAQRQLAQVLGVNRSTVVTALEELQAEGLIEGKQGRGTRVANNTWTLMAATPLPDWNAYIKAGMYKPNLTTIQEINQAEINTDIIRLGTGELSPQLYPKNKMQRVLMSLSDRLESLGYEQPKGLLALREELRRYFKSIGINTSPSSILIVSGALQALQLISVGLLHQGSTIFLEKPSYPYSLQIFQSAGMKLFGLPMDENGLKPEAVHWHQKQGKRGILYTIPSFHNPTGMLMSEQRREELLLTCEKEQLPIIEDDIYRELWIDAPTPKPLKAADKNGLVLYLGSLSKSLSPGLRIGWIVGPEPVIERLADIKMQTDYGASSLSQWAAAEWLSSGLYYSYLEEVRQQLRIRREVTITALEKYFKDIASWQVPKGGFYIWLKIIPDISMKKLFEQALSEGILLNPGNIYNQNIDQYIRLSYSYASLSDIEKGICLLSEIVKELALQ